MGGRVGVGGWVGGWVGSHDARDSHQISQRSVEWSAAWRFLSCKYLRMLAQVLNNLRLPRVAFNLHCHIYVSCVCAAMDKHVWSQRNRTNGNELSPRYMRVRNARSHVGSGSCFAHSVSLGFLVCAASALAMLLQLLTRALGSGSEQEVLQSYRARVVMT